MDLRGAGERIRELWRWESARTLLIMAAGITAVISLFEFRLDPLAMLREVASNFITSASITFLTATLVTAANAFPPAADPDRRRTLLLLLLLPVGGVLGGLLGWGVNHLLFPYRISHPAIYLLIVASLALVFGLALTAYQKVSERLAEAVARLAEREVREQQLRRLKTQAELDALRARVNPHFLFNTLNSIASLIPVDPARAERTVQRLSNLFRYMLTAGDREVVTLDEELAIVAEYLEIEKERLGRRLEYAVDCDDSVRDVRIPAMILQPLVENSVKHAIVPKREGGRIEIRCRPDGDRCSITISDTGGGFDVASGGEGFGIPGVRQRLALTYPGSHEFEITGAGETTVRIGIPIADAV